jgi:hypothetical protein
LVRGQNIQKRQEKHGRSGKILQEVRAEAGLSPCICRGENNHQLLKRKTLKTNESMAFYQWLVGGCRISLHVEEELWHTMQEYACTV